MVFNSLQLALCYLAAHPARYIFPIKAGAKFPPLIKNNLADASNDPTQITAWVKKFGQCNWGVALKKSRLMVVDVDTKPGKVGRATYDALDLIHGWPDTETVETPSGGFHLYYDGEHVFAIGKNGFGQDIDSPNYTLIAGCTFKDGTSYKDVSLEDAQPTPEWFYDVIRSAKVRNEHAGDTVIDELDKPSAIEWAKNYLLNDAAPAIEGQGGELQTFKVAAALRDHGISEAMAVELMNDIYNVPGKCEPAWEHADLARKIRNAYTHASQTSAGGKTAEAEFADDVDFDPASIPASIMGPRAKQTSDKAQEDKAKTKAKPIAGKWIYVAQKDRFIQHAMPRVEWKKASFDNFYRDMTTRATGKSYADFMLKKGGMTKFEETCFRPGEQRNMGTMFNLYTPPDIIPAAGDTKWWHAHLAYLFPDIADRDHLLNWLAWMIQNLTLKPKHALILQGPDQGTGKTFISKVFTRLLHRDNVSIVSQSNLKGEFNGWAEDAKLIVIEELRAVERTEVNMALHDLITEEVVSVNDKGISIHQVENCFGIFAMTNHDAALVLDNTDRRYLILKTDAKKRDAEYYTALYSRLKDVPSLAAVFHELMHRDLKGYSGQQAAPVTSAKTAMIEAGLSDLDQWLVDIQSSYPFTNRFFLIQDVIDIMPARLSRGNRLHSIISATVKQRFGCELVGQVRIPGMGVVRPYATARGQQALKLGGRPHVARWYQEDKTNSAKPGGAKEDFADDAADDLL